jgi:uncharacterized protein (TIGR02145 family)
MRKLAYLYTLIFLLSLNITAQDIIFTFEPKNATNHIDSIKAIKVNLNETAFTENSNTIRMSSFITGTKLFPKNAEGIIVYPNPFENYTQLLFHSNRNDNIKVTLINAAGQVVAATNQNITSGLNQFNISTNKNGLYILNISGNQTKFSQKIISTKNHQSPDKIEYYGYSSMPPKEKSAKTEEGDLIFFFVYSGDNITKIADSPTESKTYEVEFYECKDADGKSYPIVQIGDQWWMTENLSYKTDSNSWAYNIDEINTENYGRLYTWEAAKAACPLGWHLPTDIEWEQLAQYISDQKGPYSNWHDDWYEVGKHLKALSGWNNDGNGTDDFGFSALPGGYLGYGSNFFGIGSIGYWWSATEHERNHALFRSLIYYETNICRDYNPKDYGYSVRCVKNNFDDTLYIDVEDFSNYQTYFVRDTIQINYSITNAPIDSVCLFINNSNTQTQVIPKNSFTTVFDSVGVYKIVLRAYFSNGSIKSSIIKLIQVNNLINPNIFLHCTRIDGDQNYFVGESLKITIRPKWDWVDLGKFIQASFFLNDIELGTTSEQPYQFATDVITETDNKIKIELIDTAGHVYIINEVLYVPINTPPKINFGFKHYNTILSGYYFSTDPIFFSTNGEDNTEVSYINYYVDDRFVGSDTIEEEYFVFLEKKVDTIGIGKHSCFCIAYDDRGDSTISDTLEFVVYKSFSFGEKFIDIDVYKNKDITYALSASKLYRIDNENEIVEAEYTLPYANPIGLYMSEISGLLYIGFNNGTIINFNDDSRAFVTVVQQLVSNMSDFEIDDDLDIVITIANSNIQLINLNSNKIYNSNVSLESGSSLAIDTNNKLIIAGGNPGISRSDIFKLSYNSDSVFVLLKKDLGGYADKIILDPFGSNFLVLPYTRVYNTGYYTYDISDFSELGKYSRYNLHRGCYGNLKSQFYAGDDFNNQICVFNKADFSLANEYYIPNKTYMDFDKIISSANDTKLIISTVHTFDGNMRLIFLRL